jgi:beta-lactamase class A
MQSILQHCEACLGNGGELGLSARLYSPEREMLDEVAFKHGNPLPMASLVKVPIAMTLVSETPDDGTAMGHTLTVDSATATPGPLRNPLDHLYFLPWQTTRQESLGQLLAFMLQWSDNTAADALLRHVWGSGAVMRWLSKERILGVQVQRSILELLVFYYALDHLPSRTLLAPIAKGPFEKIAEVVTTVRRIAPAYACRMERERRLVETGEDSCTPAALSDLLERIASRAACKDIFNHMLHCKTGRRRMLEGLKTHAPLVTSIAHKTGTLGSITNDAGIMHFKSGQWAVLTVLACKSERPLAVREQVIADATAAVVSHWRDAGYLR